MTALPVYGVGGRATIPGRHNIAHRKGPSPHVTTRRSGMTALPFIATRGGDQLARRSVAKVGPRSPGCCASLTTFASRNHSALRNARPPGLRRRLHHRRHARIRRPQFIQPRECHHVLPSRPLQSLLHHRDLLIFALMRD